MKILKVIKYRAQLFLFFGTGYTGGLFASLQIPIFLFSNKQLLIVLYFLVNSHVPVSK